MACKKSEFISVLNSYVSARLTNDSNLINYSGSMLQQSIDSLEFDPEEEEEEVSEDSAE